MGDKLKIILTVIQVMLYYITGYKWEILTYGLFLAEVTTFIVALLSDNMGSYSGIMAILAFSGIATAVKLELSGQQNRNRHS